MSGIHQRHGAWLEARGLDPALAEKLGLFTKTDAGGNWLVVPYVEQGKVVNHKHRLTSEKRHRMDGGAPLLLWNHDVLLTEAVQAGQQPVIITEGEWDALAAIQCGFQYTVSVPNGAPKEETPTAGKGEDDAERYRFLWRSRALLDNVSKFILATDADGPGNALRADLARRLGPERCLFVTYPEGCKDLNEVLFADPVGGIGHVISNAKPYPIKGVYRFDDYPDPPPLKPISIGLPVHDDCYFLVVGTLTVWTGFAGAGKTSLLMFIIANLLRRGLHIAMGSFETAVKPILQQKLREAISRTASVNLRPEQIADADAILRERFTIVAQDSDDPEHELTLEETLELARVSVMRDGCKLFIVDPWNEIEHKRRPDESELAYTSRAIRAWKAFARSYQCAVWIVAHPRKPAEYGKSATVPGLYDVSGSADWANKADYGIVVHRPDKKSTIVEMNVTKVRMGHPGREQGIKLDWQWVTASYGDGGNDD